MMPIFPRTVPPTGNRPVRRDRTEVAELAKRDPDDLAAMVRETLDDMGVLMAANVAYRQTLGWLLGHPSRDVRAATDEAIARFAPDRPENPTPRTADVAHPGFHGLTEAVAEAHGWDVQ